MNWEDYENIAKQVKELEKKHNDKSKQETSKDIHGDCQYIWAPEKGGATILYIFAVIFGSIFNARIIIWIISTLVYFNFINTNK